MASSAATASVSESAGVLNLTVILSASTVQTATVDYLSSNGTAKAGSDYGAVAGNVVFAPGQTSKSISIPIINDLNDEPNETFTLTLSNPGNAKLGTPSSTTVTITDDDSPPTLAWQSASFSVGEAAGSGLATAQLSAASGFTVTVTYATSPGTATAGSDYTTTNGTLTFAPGETSKSVSVPILDDPTVEPNETLNLTLSSPTNATLGTPNPATLTILDDDGAAPPTDEVYTYNKLGNLTSKTGKGSYSYPATGSAHPHAVTSTSDGQTYVYDANGNMTGTGGLISLYDAENRPTQLRRISGTEDYTYDADGERVTRTFGFTTTVYLGGVWEEDVVDGVSQGTRSLYGFNGVVVAQRTGAARRSICKQNTRKRLL